MFLNKLQLTIKVAQRDSGFDMSPIQINIEGHAKSGEYCSRRSRYRFGIVQNVTKVQDWLATPLLYPTPNSQSGTMAKIHIRILGCLHWLVSRPGSIAAALELMDGGNGQVDMNQIMFSNLLAR